MSSPLMRGKHTHKCKMSYEVTLQYMSSIVTDSHMRMIYYSTVLTYDLVTLII